MAFSLFTSAAFAVGLLLYGAIVFWSGKRGLWWLALLVTMPAIFGGMMSLSIDMSQSSSPLFRNFKWLVITQIVIGIIVYRMGSAGSREVPENTKGFDG